MVHFFPKEDRYEALRTKQEYRLKNFKLASPASHAITESDFLCISESHRNDDYLNAMHFVTYEKVKKFGEQVFPPIESVTILTR